MTATESKPIEQQLARGERFAFGKNWARFLRTLDERRIAEAEKGLGRMLPGVDLAGKTFLDVGCGSGLSSLAARRLGATVNSFDYDPQSVACTRELKRRYFHDDGRWTVEEGSVLDAGFLRSLGSFDIVYSWGVLHHTGAMWQALDNVSLPVAPGGRLFIAIYNDQGPASEMWKRVKRRYNRLPALLRYPYAVLVMVPHEIPFAYRPSALLHPRGYVRDWLRYLDGWKRYREKRGMSRWHDIIDWVGGYPFEVATPEQIQTFYEARGFTLETIKRTDGLGNNEFVFRKA